MGRKQRPPLEYRNDLLEEAFGRQRGLNVTRLCSDLHMSRQTFYAILRGGARVKKEKVLRVAEALGANSSDIFA